MKIYTKTGDDGNTGLQGDFRIAKSHPRIISYGTVDEANAAIGVVQDVALLQLQSLLFDVGADPALPRKTIKFAVSIWMTLRF